MNIENLKYTISFLKKLPSFGEPFTGVPSPFFMQIR